MGPNTSLSSLSMAVEPVPVALSEASRQTSGATTPSSLGILPDCPSPERPQNMTKPLMLDQDFIVACTALVGRTGAKAFQLRYSDEEEPTIWMCVAEYRRPGNPKSGNPQQRMEKTVFQVAAGMSVREAAYALLERLIDGGQCTHCRKPTGVSDDWEDMPLNETICWYQYDPELKTFRRGCE
jgi:hypothetical protein